MKKVGAIKKFFEERKDTLINVSLGLAIIGLCIDTVTIIMNFKPTRYDE